MHGINSFLLGAVSLVVVVPAKHAESFLHSGSSTILNLANRLGLLLPAMQDPQLELKEPGLLSFTDASALLTVIYYGAYLAVAAILLAAWAEYREENSLYLSAGFMCGATSLVVANYTLGMLAMVLGGGGVLAIRRAKRV